MRALLRIGLETLIAAGLITAGGVAAQTPPDKAAAKTAPVQNVAVTDPSYKIGPQDVLRIDVWKEAEVSRAVPVRPDGKISLPLLNDVQAAGLTPMQLSGVIADGLKKYMNDPQFTVSLSEINNRRIYMT